MNSEPRQPSLLADVLPDTVARSEAFGDLPGVVTFAEEEAAVARAVPRRQREYRTVRHCARAALGSLGVSPAPILSGPGREPLWPGGFVGSLTHCAGYRAAAVARQDEFRAVGIDAEPHEPLPEGVLDYVATGEEPRWLAEQAAASASSSASSESESVEAVHWDRLLFCAKEATYKVWYPLTGRWLGFEHAAVSICPAEGSFTSTLLVPGPVVDGRPLDRLTGRWTVRRGLVVAAIVLAAR